MVIVLTLPWAIAPTISTTGPSSGMSVFGSMTSALKVITYFFAPAGKWSATGFFMTFQNEEHIQLHQTPKILYLLLKVTITFSVDSKKQKTKLCQSKRDYEEDWVTLIS